MAQAKDPKAAKKKKWKPFKAADYDLSIASLIHFSAKTTNSNTPSFGIRLGKMDRQDLPFVAVSTMDPDSISPDYEGDPRATATILAQVSAVLENRLDDFDSVPPDEAFAIGNAIKILKEPYETNSSSVGKRLRQIIVQDMNGQDIALTPLQSAGFSALLETRLREEEEKETPAMDRWRGFLGLGGANPQNVGRHVRAMNRPLWFDAPRENNEIRKAFAIHYKGIRLAVPQFDLLDYYSWRKKLLDEHGGVMPSDLELRGMEISKLKAMTDTILGRADEAAKILEKHRDRLPGEGLLHESLPLVQKGLLDLSQRNADWVREFARTLHEYLLDARVYVNGELRSLGIGAIETTRWISIIEDLI